MQTIARDMAQFQQGSKSNNNNPQGAVERQPITEEQVQLWVNQLEQWTNVFYNEVNAQNLPLWQEAQAKLVQFQKIHNPFELCTEIIKKSRNSLVLYQVTLCLKNSVSSEFKKHDMDELFELFQFLYEFLCAKALENEMSVNETTALICAIILKRVASERVGLSNLAMLPSHYRQSSPATDKESYKITPVISTLCNNIKNLNENLSTKVASALLLNSLLQECQMSNRSSLLGIRVWKHLNARRLIEAHLKSITEVCLESINWAFSSNLLNPSNQSRETQILFHLTGSLIKCVEYCLSFDSTETGCSSGGDRVLRLIQNRTINMLSQTNEHDKRTKIIREWCSFAFSPTVVQFLFHLYATVKSMISCSPDFNWPKTVLKSCVSCLYYLSDINNSINIEKDQMYSEYVGNLMMGTVKVMDNDVQGVDDSYQIASLMTSISMHASEQRDAIIRLKVEHLVPFLDAAQRYTCKVFTQVASTVRADEEEEEEKTVDALLDFWYHLLRNIQADIKACASAQPPRQPKVSNDAMKAYSRVITESYISCHLHKPLGQLVPKNYENQELDLDQIDDYDDNTIHGQQLISFGSIARFDPIHSAKLFIELMSTRIGHFEALLTQFINTDSSPETLKDWELINDDLHWLFLMLQHFLCQTGYGEIGFMCNEILLASVEYNSNLEKTVNAFKNCDYSSPEVDPIVRLIIITIKLCQIEMGICQSGKLNWLSSQTNRTISVFMSRFCLSYLYPKECDYAMISQEMNFCFGVDAEDAEKFLKFVVEHSCCIILFMKSDAEMVKRKVQLLIQLLIHHPNTMTIMKKAEEGSMTKAFLSQMRPENLTGFSPQVAKSLIKLVTRLFVEEDDWNKLVEFFTNKWAFIMSCIQSQDKSEMASGKFLEFCDFAVGVCEACDDDTSERLFDQLLVPIVKTLPDILRAFGNFETVPIAVFELLYYIVKLPMVNIASWESDSAKLFYEDCSKILEAYSQIASIKKNRTEEEDCEDIASVLTFCQEVMKRDWGHSWASCDKVVKFAMEKISAIMRPEYLQFPKIRQMYYRLLVYLVDDDDRLASLSDTLLNTIVSSVILALQSQFDKDVDCHTYTIIGIVCRAIHLQQDAQNSERLSKFMLPVLPALFHATIGQRSYTVSNETAEMLAPALFSLRCCYLEIYRTLVKELIERQDDPYTQSKVKSLFENLESKISKLTLNRASCREFIVLFVPFLAELQNYVMTT